MRAIFWLMSDGTDSLGKHTSSIHSSACSSPYCFVCSVPWRRSYLFHGKPGTPIVVSDSPSEVHSHLSSSGCGKTSFATALAGVLNRSICVLTLSGKNMNDTYLNQ